MDITLLLEPILNSCILIVCLKSCTTMNSWIDDVDGIITCTWDRKSKWMLINECEHCYEAHKAINWQNPYTFPHFLIQLMYQYTESYRYNEDQDR